MDKAILQTLLYSSLFNYPLTEQEIWRWLIIRGKKVSDGKQADKKEFEIKLKELLDKKQIYRNCDYYFLPGQENIIRLRAKRENWSELKIQIAQKTVIRLSKISSIKLIGVTGSLAMKNTDKKADIDLFFIIKPGYLWLTRLLVVFYLKSVRLYRQKGRVENKICPNMFIAENNLKIFPKNLFQAHEICQLVPLYDRDETYDQLLAANSWVKEYLPNAIFERKGGRAGRREGKIKNRGDNQFVTIFESLAMRLQLWRMRKKRTKEVVERDLIKFHPHDAGVEIMRKYQNLLKLISKNG